MAKIFSQVSDQETTVKEQDTEFIYTIHKCPVCWGRTDLDKPSASLPRGFFKKV
jgi:rRNA maturation protein Nop10